MSETRILPDLQASLMCEDIRQEANGNLMLLGVLANQSAVAIENSRLYTDLESAHEQVVESQRQLLISAKLAAIGELAGGVAHEVNNPLQIILSRVQLMSCLLYTSDAADE